MSKGPDQVLVKKETYSVKLENFEGPLDLLLYLIKKEEVDIYHIPIAHITKQYLNYMQLMQMLDLEVAGEFILMAATLIQIKAKMLLPQSDSASEEDPRTELVTALLEYKKYKEAAGILEQRRNFEACYYPRMDFSFLPKGKVNFSFDKASLYDLIFAFKKVLEDYPKNEIHTVNIPDLNIEDRIEFVSNYLKEKSSCLFEELFVNSPNRVYIIMTFLAILELARQRKIRIQQKGFFKNIWIYSNHNQEGENP